MVENVISVLTYKSVQTILDTGGSQSWALSRQRAKGCTYAVVCRNANTREAEDNTEHGTAFLVGKISDVVPSTNHDGRWLLVFSEYAPCSFPDQWEGRNPVAYWTTDDYPDINFDALTFQPMPKAELVPPATAPSNDLTIADAKLALSRTFGVQPSAIEITIRA